MEIIKKLKVKKTSLSFTLPDEYIEKIKSVAKKEERSLNYIINKAIKCYLDNL